MKKFLWYSDLHLNSAFPWAKLKMCRSINKENPAGLFITGDISNGLFLQYDLGQLAKHISCPIYFTLGNHDGFWTGFERSHKVVRKLCEKYSHLHWLDESPVLELDEDVAVIGERGWYDISLGDPKFIKYTFDWMFTPDFLELGSMEARYEKFKEIATISAQNIEVKLIEALEKYKTVYLLTHFPIFAEATSDQESLFGKFWLPYNINFRLGETVKKIMKDRKKQNLFVLAGHVHERIVAHISRNITAFTANASYWGVPKNDNRIFI